MHGQDDVVAPRPHERLDMHERRYPIGRGLQGQREPRRLLLLPLRDADAGAEPQRELLLLLRPGAGAARRIMRPGHVRPRLRVEPFGFACHGPRHSRGRLPGHDAATRPRRARPADGYPAKQYCCNIKPARPARSRRPAVIDDGGLERYAPPGRRRARVADDLDVVALAVLHERRVVVRPRSSGAAPVSRCPCRRPRRRRRETRPPRRGAPRGRRSDRRRPPWGRGPARRSSASESPSRTRCRRPG